MIKIYLSFLFAFITLYSSAQRVDYDNSSRWFLGLNLGGTWNSTDVKNKTATGFGFTLGKSYNYGYGKALSFDLRARYLRGFWYGQDADTTSLANYTGTALSSYKNSLGFTINNFQADVHRLAFELVIHGNGILESTGFDPYIFGGIGLTWAQTFGDLSNDFGSYAYDSLLQNNQLSSSDLENTLDGIYDSPLDGSSNRYMVNFMPSLGFGLGYQVGKRTTIGIEHKTTFTLADNFDGYASSLPRAKNDRYHYTSLYLQFRFKARESQVSDTSVNSSTNVNNYNSVCPSPIISVSNQTTTENNYQYELEATITNINKANEIIVTDQFGNSVPFTYLSNINRLRANIDINSWNKHIYHNCAK
jgi:large repetitive protein